jgi:hypothetical protein
MGSSCDQTGQTSPHIKRRLSATASSVPSSTLLLTTIALTSSPTDDSYSFLVRHAPTTPPNAQGERKSCLLSALQVRLTGTAKLKHPAKKRSVNDSACHAALHLFHLRLPRLRSPSTRLLPSTTRSRSLRPFDTASPLLFSV